MGTNSSKLVLEDANDEPHSGHLSTSITDENVVAVKKITIGEIVEDNTISFGSCHNIFFKGFGHETSVSGETA
uniref:Uncharacterized protein n=1 Tax=Lepeophtheirus salmonis TaxID=72036 RepID=A0A0K2SWV5_LEPSM